MSFKEYFKKYLSVYRKPNLFKRILVWPVRLILWVIRKPTPPSYWYWNDPMDLDVGLKNAREYFLSLSSEEQAEVLKLREEANNHVMYGKRKGQKPPVGIGEIFNSLFYADGDIK